MIIEFSILQGIPSENKWTGVEECGMRTAFMPSEYGLPSKYSIEHTDHFIS